MHDPQWMATYALMACMGIGPSLVGLFACLRYWSRSRWVALLVAGFILQILVALGQRTLTFFVTRATLPAARLGFVYAVASVFYAIAELVLIGGIVGLLQEHRGAAPTATAPGPPPVD
jgi:hypothetical protein